MSRRKQTLSAVKDLSPLPDAVSPPAKRIRRGAADRSREKVKSYVRLLQRDGTEADRQRVHPSATKGLASVAQSSRGRGKDAGAIKKNRGKRARSPSPTQVVTITIRDDDDEPVATTAATTVLNPVRQLPLSCARRSGRQYVVVDYSRLHFGSTDEPEEEEEPIEERDGWPTVTKPSPLPIGGGPRRGRPPKANLQGDQPTKASELNAGPAAKGNGAFICRRCDMGHETVEDFLSHFEAAHCPDLTDDEFRQRLYSNIYFCGRCEFQTSEKAELESHEIQHNLQPNPLISKWHGRYHCSRCDFSATNAVTLSHHNKTHQRSAAGSDGTAKTTESVVFACAECTARFADRQDVLRHQQLVHGRGSMTDL